MLPVVLHGCKTWSLTLREERSVRVIENRVFRTIFGPKKEGVTGKWRKLHMRSLILDQIKKNDMVGTCSTYGKKRGTYINLVGKPEGKRSHRRPRR
jgi:hypothetical protein